MVSIPMGTAIIAVATFFGAFLGAVAKFVIERFNMLHHRESLRRSFLAELQGFPNLVDGSFAKVSNGKGETSLIPTKVYNSTIQDVGSLGADEASNIVQFYTGVDAYNQLRGGMDEDEREEFLNSLQQRREITIECLKQAKNESFWSFLRGY